MEQRQDVGKQVENVLARKRDPEKMHKTIFEELRDSDLPPQEKTTERLMDEGLILTGAGGETTAQTLTVLSFHLLSNPEVLKKLRAELKQVMPDPNLSVPWQKLEQLPYMVNSIHPRRWMRACKVLIRLRKPSSSKPIVSAP